MGNACPPPFTTISMPPLCSMVLQYFVPARAMQGVGPTLLGFRGCNLWVLQYLLGIIWVSLGIAILCACSSHARCWGSGDVIYRYCNTYWVLYGYHWVLQYFVPESYARCWGSGDVIYGYCLWRGGHDPQPSWVHVSSTIPPVTPANYNLHPFHILDPGWDPGWDQREVLVPRSRRAFSTQQQL